MPYFGDVIANPNISARGVGKPGYCTLCSISDDKTRKALTKQYQQGNKAPSINAWLLANIGKGFDRRTIYSHRQHIKSPKDRLVGAVVARQASDPSLPQQVTEDEFLQRIIDAAAANLATSPESVTIDQGIKAASTKLGAKASNRAGMTVLFATLTAIPEGPPTLLLQDGSIEGEVVEVPEP